MHLRVVVVVLVDTKKIAVSQRNNSQKERGLRFLPSNDERNCESHDEHIQTT